MILSKKVFAFARRYLLTIVSLIYASTFGVFLKSGRLLLRVTEMWFIDQFKEKYVWRFPKVNPEIFFVPDAINLVHVPIQEGNATPFEVLVLVSMIKKYNPARIFEIGTFDGRTALNILNNAPLNAVVYTLDLPPSDASEQLTLNYRNEDVNLMRYSQKQSGDLLNNLTDSIKNRVVRLYGDSATFNYTPYQKNMDFIFVDGSHSYDYVLSDSENALKMVSDTKSIIVWHDFNNVDDVARALNKFSTLHPQVKIKRINGTKFAFAEIEKI